MRDPVDALVLDLLEWIGSHPKPYSEVIEVWRTSCPRLPVWEEANARGYLMHRHSGGHEALVSVSELGARHLAESRPRIRAAFVGSRIPGVGNGAA
jgi:hypothetical protein